MKWNETRVSSPARWRLRAMTMPAVLVALLLGGGSALAADEGSPAATYGPEQLDTLAEMHIQGYELWEQGELVEARAIQEEVLEARTRILGPEHPDTLSTLNDLGLTLESQGELTRAREIFERLLEARTRVLGPDHENSIGARSNLAIVLFGLGDVAGSRDLTEQVLEDRTRVLGPEHPDTIGARNNLTIAQLASFLPMRVGPLALGYGWGIDGSAFVAEDPAMGDLIARLGKDPGDISGAFGEATANDGSTALQVGATRIRGTAAEDWAFAPPVLTFELDEAPPGYYVAWRDIEGRRAAVVSFDDAPDVWLAVYPVGDVAILFIGSTLTVEDVMAAMPPEPPGVDTRATSDAEQHITMMNTLASFDQRPMGDLALNLSMPSEAWEHWRIEQGRATVDRMVARLDAVDVRECFQDAHASLRSGAEALRVGFDMILAGEDEAGKSTVLGGFALVSEGKAAGETAADACVPATSPESLG